MSFDNMKQLLLLSSLTNALTKCTLIRVGVYTFLMFLLCYAQEFSWPASLLCKTKLAKNRMHNFWSRSVQQSVVNLFLKILNIVLQRFEVVNFKRAGISREDGISQLTIISHCTFLPF